MRVAGGWYHERDPQTIQTHSLRFYWQEAWRLCRADGSIAMPTIPISGTGVFRNRTKSGVAAWAGEFLSAREQWVALEPEGRHIRC
jgi:hypothetical protein